MGCADNKDDFSGSTATPIPQPCSSLSFLSFQQRSSADSTHVALQAYRYFWTNILHLIRHVLLNRNFFRHPSITGDGKGGGADTGAGPTTCVLLFLAMEQTLCFGAGITDCISGVGQRIQGRGQVYHDRVSPPTRSNNVATARRNGICELRYIYLEDVSVDFRRSLF